MARVLVSYFNVITGYNLQHDYCTHDMFSIFFLQEVKGICYYSAQDVSLGQFLRDSCFNLGLKCQNPSCKKSVLEHSLSFIHNDSLINITVGKLQLLVFTQIISSVIEEDANATTPAVVHQTVLVLNFGYKLLSLLLIANYSHINTSCYFQLIQG